MSLKTASTLLVISVVALASGSIVGPAWAASAGGKSWTLSDLYDFTGTPDGYSPISNLVEDAAGNLYGTAFEGGDMKNVCATDGCGVIFELSPRNHGHYNETVLYSFTGGDDGCTPLRGVILDSSGNLYGAAAGCGANGLGNVYELSPQKGGWKQTVLYSFSGAANGDGSTPYATLIFDSKGVLYGTTYTGGAGTCNNNGLPGGCGTVYALTPGQSGWTESVLYNFVGGANDGANPAQGMIMNGKGVLYGITSFGGPHTQGALYQLAPGKQGGWTESVIHTFPDGTNDGAYPVGIPAIDGDGNLYGTSSLGGRTEYGAIWEASPGKHGSWSEKVLYSFSEGEAGAAGDPYAGVILDAQGDLLGTTVEGGGGCEGFGCGTVYEWSRKTGKAKLLFAFASSDTNSPESALLMDAEGDLFGTTAFGGDVTGPHCQGILPGCGSVYELRR